MPYSGLAQRSYRETFLSSTVYTMHFIFILFFCQGLNVESAQSHQTEDAATSHSALISIGQTKGIVKELEILKPQEKNFSCTMTIIPNKPTNITGYWKKDGAKIDSQQVVPSINDKYTLTKNFDVKGLGNYSCIFNVLGSENQATFVLKVPVIKERDKPIVSYIGDSVVLSCQLMNDSNTWEWYKVNDTVKERLNDTTDSTKYSIYMTTNETKLTVLNLTKEDSGKYICSSVFSIGSSEGHIELKVLSFTEPLKPFLAIAAEVVVLVTLILLYERQNQSRKRDSSAENTSQSQQTSKLTQDETNGVDGGTTTRQRKVEQ